jgi:hypothetical protein
VTEPNQRTSSVRRTVTIAVALVVGQLALCSVIGWVTFGDLLHPASSAQRDTGAPAATLPLVEPPVATPSSTPVPTAPTSPPSHAAPPVRTAAVPTTRPSAVRPAGTGKVIPSATAEDVVLLPAPGSSEAVQEKAKRNKPCSPENALGRTADGVWLRCLQADDGELRWRAV